MRPTQATWFLLYLVLGFAHSASASGHSGSIDTTPTGLKSSSSHSVNGNHALNTNQINGLLAAPIPKPKRSRSRRKLPVEGRCGIEPVGSIVLADIEGKGYCMLRSPPNLHRGGGVGPLICNKDYPCPRPGSPCGWNVVKGKKILGLWSTRKTVVDCSIGAMKEAGQTLGVEDGGAMTLGNNESSIALVITPPCGSLN